MNSIDILLEAFKSTLIAHNITIDTKYIYSQLGHDIKEAKEKHKSEIINAILYSQFHNMYSEEYDWEDVKNAIIDAEKYYQDKLNTSK